MRKILLISVALLPIAFGQCSSALEYSGTIQGAQYVIYMPPASCFNGDMILYAHGYVQVGAPAGSWMSQLTLPDGTNLPALLNGLGFGFAASGYSKDGLAILQGMEDTAALTMFIQTLPIPVTKFFITGASEGGLIATKLVEQNPLYDGGVAVCGPIGDFQAQINYLGDVRVLFDYFFPGVLSSAGGSAIDIPPSLMANWTTVYEPAVVNAVNSNPLAAVQLINTAGIEIGWNFANAADAITGALWYNVFATTDAETTLGGNPYDNIGRVYQGSLNDVGLNATVARFSASPAALISIRNYQTSGLVKIPLVTLHTIADPIVPYWQESLYANKVQAENSTAEVAQLPSFAYGHCNVSVTDAETALLVLLLKVYL
jgi:alpha-beta hydrolase superfamily lysophospholipase